MEWIKCDLVHSHHSPLPGSTFIDLTVVTVVEPHPRQLEVWIQVTATYYNLTGKKPCCIVVVFSPSLVVVAVCSRPVTWSGFFMVIGENVVSSRRQWIEESSRSYWKVVWAKLLSAADMVCIYLTGTPGMEAAVSGASRVPPLVTESIAFT